MPNSAQGLESPKVFRDLEELQAEFALLEQKLQPILVQMSPSVNSLAKESMGTDLDSKVQSVLVRIRDISSRVRI